MDNRVVEMDVMCELASEITDYIWFSSLRHADNDEPDFEDENGDTIYKDEAQDIFNIVLDKIDETINPQEDN